MITVKCEFDDAGNPKIDVVGATGTSCKDLTKSLEDAFGGKVLEDTVKREFYQGQTAAKQQEAHN